MAKAAKIQQQPKLECSTEIFWITIPLTYLGDAATADQLESELRKIFKEEQVFIPKFTQKDSRHEKEIVLFQGYVFVGVYDRNKKVPSLTGNPYFEQPLMSPSKLIQFTRNVEIEKLRTSLVEMRGHGVVAGSRVRIETGVYRNLEGEVVDTSTTTVMVQIRLASKEIMVNIPPNFLSQVE